MRLEFLQKALAQDTSGDFCFRVLHPEVSGPPDMKKASAGYRDFYYQRAGSGEFSGEGLRLRIIPLMKFSHYFRHKYRGRWINTAIVS
nr:hypothetical protein [Klebsiella pneumoniae]